MKGIKLALLLSAAFSALSILLGGFNYGYDIHSIVVLGAMGAVIGLVGAPEVAPEYFKYPIIWQPIFATCGCLLFSYLLNATIIGYFIAAIVGIILGLTAKHWVKHVTFP